MGHGCAAVTHHHGTKNPDSPRCQDGSAALLPATFPRPLPHSPHSHDTSPSFGQLSYRYFEPLRQSV
eukprot:3207436-Amphidinium_carterae.1